MQRDKSALSLGVWSVNLSKKSPASPPSTVLVRCKFSQASTEREMLSIFQTNVICLVSFLTPSSEWVIILHLLLQMKEEILESLLTYSSRLTLLRRNFPPSFGIPPPRPKDLLIPHCTVPGSCQTWCYSLCTCWNTHAEIHTPRVQVKVQETH